MPPIAFVYARLHALYIRRPYLVGVLFFAIMQSLVLAALMQDPATRALIFWYCNNVPFFFALALWQGDLQWVKGLSYVGIVPQLLWIADFLSHLVGFDLSHTADYVFIEGFTFSNDVSVLIHFAVPLVTLAYTMRIRPQPRSLAYSAIYIGGIYIATLAGTNLADDVNCVFQACSQYEFAYHAVLWPFYMAILALGGYAIHVALYRFARRYDTLLARIPHHVMPQEGSA